MFGLPIFVPEFRRRSTGAGRMIWQADADSGAQEVESLALYNGQRTLLLSVQKAQDENTISVVADPLRGRPRPPVDQGGQQQGP